MGKKSKRGSKLKKGKTSLPKPPKRPQIDPETLKELTKDLKDIFRFPNGDVYVGQFTLTVEGEVLRHGSGKYFTDDGYTFNGRWENDVLVEAEKISFPDGCWYKGPLENGKYAGLGTYSLPQLGILECSFVQRRPHGLVILTDNGDNKWEGKAAFGSLTLVPRNHLYDSEDALIKSAAIRSHHSSLPSNKDVEIPTDDVILN